MAKARKPETLARDALNAYLAERVPTTVSADGILAALGDAGLTITEAPR